MTQVTSLPRLEGRRWHSYTSTWSWRATRIARTCCLHPCSAYSLRSPYYRPGGTFTASSNIPIRAGLGSSAAYSTCIASALLLAHGGISLPKPQSPSLSRPSTPSGSLTDDGQRLSPHDVDLVDGWAFLSEKLLHGNPSGIDNAVSVRGGAVAFTRSVGGKEGGLHGLHGCVYSCSSAAVGAHREVLISKQFLIHAPTAYRHSCSARHQVPRRWRFR